VPLLRAQVLQYNVPCKHETSLLGTRMYCIAIDFV
jgi:hypothetical protein